MPNTPAPTIRRTLALASLVALGSLVASGCETESTYADKKAKEAAQPVAAPVLVLRHHVGGTHHRSVVLGDLWYATFANQFLVISAESGTVLASRELMPFGTSGAATELVVLEGRERAFVLLDGTAVVEVTLAAPRDPRIVSVRRWNEIGFPPRSISVARGEVWISGDGGVVPWSEVAKPLPEASSPEEAIARAKLARKEALPPTPRLEPLARSRGAIGPVVESSEGLIAPAGRRVFRIEDGTFVGAASRLDPIPAVEATRIGLISGGFLFTLQGSEGAQVGIMGPDVREIDAKAIAGVARRVRLLNGTLFAVNDESILAFPVAVTAEGPRLGEPTFISVKGARDLDRIDDNYFAVVGSFGRALYRWRADDRGPGDTFFEARREPSRLTFASTDRRRILAGGLEGSWVYTIGDDVSLVNQPVTEEYKPRTKAAGAWGSAEVSADRDAVLIKPAGGVALAKSSKGAVPPTEIEWRPRFGGAVAGVETIGNRLWIWHRDGVDVVDVANGQLLPAGSVRLEGPVRYLFPQRVGSAAAYVSEFGGFGLLDFVARDALPEIGGQRIVDLDGDGENDVILTEREMLGAKRDFDSVRIDFPTTLPDKPAAKDRVDAP